MLVLQDSVSGLKEDGETTLESAETHTDVKGTDSSNAERPCSRRQINEDTFIKNHRRI